MLDWQLVSNLNRVFQGKERQLLRKMKYFGSLTCLQTFFPYWLLYCLFIYLFELYLMLVQLIVFVNKDQTTFNNNKKNPKKQNKIDFSKINLHILKCYLNKSGDSNQYFSSSFSLSFNSIDVFQFLKGWSNCSTINILWKRHS